MANRRIKHSITKDTQGYTVHQRISCGFSFSDRATGPFDTLKEAQKHIREVNRRLEDSPPLLETLLMFCIYLVAFVGDLYALVV